MRNELVKVKVNTNNNGYIVADESLMPTQTRLFAAGDVRAGSTKQAASAGGEDDTADLLVRKYLKEND